MLIKILETSEAERELDSEAAALIGDGLGYREKRI